MCLGDFIKRAVHGGPCHGYTFKSVGNINQCCCCYWRRLSTKLHTMKGEKDFPLVRCLFYVHEPKKEYNKIISVKSVRVPNLKSESSIMSSVKSMNVQLKCNSSPSHGLESPSLVCVFKCGVS